MTLETIGGISASNMEFGDIFLGKANKTTMFNIFYIDSRPIYICIFREHIR